MKELAFTHSSYAHDHNLRNNERVEFLGDSVLSLIVSDYLYKNMRQDEGKMTKVKASFVCTESLSALAKKLKIEDRIKLGKSFQGKISAVPSIVFKHIFPENPSQTTTSQLPRITSRDSIFPMKLSFDSLSN